MRSRKVQEKDVLRARAATTVIFLVNGMAVGLWVPHIPLVRARLHLDERQLSLSLLGTALGAVAAMPLTGRMINRFGSRIPTTATALGHCASLIPLAIVSSLAPLCAATMVFGFFGGALDVAMNAHASRVEAACGRPIMSAFHGFWSLGAMIGSLFASLRLKLDYGVPSTLLLGAFFLALMTGAASSALLPGRDPRAAKTESPLSGLPPRALLLIGLMTLLGMICEGAVSNWTGVFLNAVVGMNIANAGLVFTGLSLAATVGRIGLGDRASHRWGRRRVLIGAALLGASGVTAALIFRHPKLSPAGLAVAWLGITGFVPLLYSEAAQTEGMPAATALSTVATIGYLGFVLGPPLIGALAQSFGLTFALAVIPFTCLAVAGLGYRFLAAS